MTYFTPELFQRTNSPDMDESLAASDLWEQNLLRYQRRLNKIRSQLPGPVLEFLDGPSLHDAEVLDFVQSSIPVLSGEHSVAWLFVRLSQSFMVLEYRLSQPPVVERRVLPASLCSTQATWLYDEVEIVQPETYSHEIFISTGTLIKLVFTQFKLARGEALLGAAAERCEGAALAQS
jgi:hypothetical protein